MEEYFNANYIRDMICMGLFCLGLALSVTCVLMGIVFKSKNLSDLLFNMKFLVAFILLACVSYAMMGIESKEAMSLALSYLYPVIMTLTGLIAIGVAIILRVPHQERKQRREELEREYVGYNEILFYPVTISKNEEILEHWDMAITLDKQEFHHLYIRNCDTIRRSGHRINPENTKLYYPVNIGRKELGKVFKGKEAICRHVMSQAKTWEEIFPAGLEFMIEYVNVNIHPAIHDQIRGYKPYMQSITT